LLRGLVPRRVEVVGEVTGAVVVVIHAPIVACTPSPVNQKARLRVPYTGFARIYGTSCLTYQGTPKKLGLLSSWDSYIIT
jgi:hypothetical protein